VNGIGGGLADGVSSSLTNRINLSQVSSRDDSSHHTRLSDGRDGAGDGGGVCHRRQGDDLGVGCDGGLGDFVCIRGCDGVGVGLGDDAGRDGCDDIGLIC
jgi:hypothetical protein